MRVVTLNLNGIRSAAAKGWVSWARGVRADCMGVQQVRAGSADVAPFQRIGALRGWFHCAQKKGYAGVAMYARHEPSDVRCGFGSREFDTEGRWIELRFDAPTLRRPFNRLRSVNPISACK